MVKFALLIGISLAGLPLFAQTTEPLPAFRWGISGSVDLPFTGIEVINGADRFDPPVQSGRQQVGGSVGVFGRWQLARSLFLQPELVVARYEQNLQFRGEGLPNGTETFVFTDVELPLHVVVSNQSEHFPIRASFLCGARMSWNLAEQTSSNLNLLQERIALDVGLGIEIPSGRYAIQPEVLYSHGLNNIHNFSNTPYDPYVGQVVRDKLQIRVLVLF